MIRNDIITEEQFEYAVRIRRQIHQRPELGFDLDETVALLTAELDKAGITYDRHYARNSLVVDLGRGDKTLLIRADMDALPVTEKTGLPYASQIPGKMHACGHDAHTAMLLTVAQILKKREAELPCRVRLMFQPSEECEISGAKAMVDGGVLEGVDAVCCTHVENALESGHLGVHAGDYMAACDPITLTFYGKTSHATIPQMGIDALAMGVEAYNGMKALVREIAGGRSKHIFSIGALHSGTAHNVIADKCEMKVSFRYYDKEFAREVRTRCLALCEAIASKFGGRFEGNWYMSAPALINNPGMTELFRTVIQEKTDIPVDEIPARMSTEDFAWLSQAKPGIIFRCGTRNEAAGCVATAHCNDFMPDEDGMRSAMAAFVLLGLNADKFVDAAK